MRSDFISDRGEIRDSIDRLLLEILIRAGCQPILVPNIIGLERKNQYLNEWLLTINPMGFVLSGGGNIGDCLSRDAVEASLLDWATLKSTPVLGICRGMQSMGLFCGGTLEKVTNHVGTDHQLIFDHEAYTFPSHVNSYHDFAFKACPPEFQVLATAEGVLEAIKHNSLPWLGIMWHPERNLPFHELDLKMIKTHFFPKDN